MRTRTKQLVDLLGISSSLLCLVHCLAAPLLLGVATAVLGHRSAWLDYVFIAFAAVAVVIASSKTRSGKVKLLLWTGLALFFSSLLVHNLGGIWDYSHIPASVLIIAGHVMNLRKERPSCAVPAVKEAS